ncbi:Nonribosomal peptide synthetase 8-like protein 3 [Colletotrichum chlorophyti]|uniref:Nonribosomal peptide synthetase 8-like protein 3 n=1 Tax=Colletotrichum chlorophyti TaxID=708187 RepID=A0A1Q8S5S1_9PEZI|nr:Nonribosomal peptide synthetase 8-like protein 3 [Colletotrichum chlorophyti]
MTGNADLDDTDAVLERLKTLVSQILGISPESADSQASFVTLGGDSFKAVHLFQKCTEQGLSIRLQDLLHRPLEEIASLSQSSATSDFDWAGNPKRQGGHERFPLMPCDYDFAKIHDELRGRFGSSPHDVEDIYPCSSMQESMYIGQKMSSKRLYRTRGLFETQEGFNLEHFEKVWDDIVSRHQILRAVFVETSDSSSGRLLDAVVLKKKKQRVTVKRVRNLEEVKRNFHSRDGDAKRHFEDEYQHRIVIYTNEESATFVRGLFQVDLNHLTVDGSSLMIIIDELIKGLQGTRLSCPAPGYGRYINYLQNQANEDEALDYWIDYLDGAEPCYFPTMNDNRGGDEGSFNVVEMGLDTTLEDLRAFCQRCNATLSSTLQVAWALVLQAYTGDPNVCFGYLSSGRSLPIMGVSDIVGPMMNLLVCRIDGINEMTLGELLDGIRDDFVNALPHQCFSIGRVQRILGTNESKLFNTIMTSYYSPSMSHDDRNNLFKLVASHNASDFDIVLKVVYSDVDIRVRLAYSTATLSPMMAEKVSHTFSSVLSRIAEKSSLRTPISEYTTISPGDLQQVTYWNSQNTFRDVPLECVHQLIEERVRLHPEAPAIYACDGEMTYKELDVAATAIAQHISELGVGPGAFIPLCFEKSKWYSVSVLAVLKSGNAFVPLDLSNPPVRIQEILCQIGVSQESGLLICSFQQASELRCFARHVLELSQVQLSASMAKANTGPLPLITPRDPAYVIFTSGSTGRPKGVVVEHGAYAYAARAHQEGIHINSSSRVLQFASYGFDTSMEDHLTTFAVGACLCVPSENDRLSLPDLASFATKAGANWAHLTPSFAEMLDPDLMPTMRTMVLGGEAMTGKCIQNWCKPGRTTLIQVYGPSECCVTTTISKVSLQDAPTNIGTAVPGCATWVTKIENPDALQHVGAVGELVVEGPILARGYLGSQEQTAHAFVQGLAWAPEKRLYRTGDLVKHDSDGHLHFVGRRDGRVKLRGQRIELGEVERQLIFEPRVQHCLVLVPKSGPCTKRLVAVVQLAESFTETDSSLSAPTSKVEILETTWVEHISCMKIFILDKLPPYMNPDLWIILKAIPRNSSGKLDRKTVSKYLEAMPSEQYSKLVTRMEDEQSDERPGTNAELLMREIWSEVLNVPEEEIGWNVSFYYLGGDSISAMTISSMARQRGLFISAADILRYRSIERVVSAAVHTSLITPSNASISTEAGAAEPFTLSPIQQLHFQAAPKGDFLDQQTMVLQVTNRVDQSVLLQAFELLVEAHPMLRARFELHDGQWTQRVLPSSLTDKNYQFRLRFHSRDESDYILSCIGEAKSSLDLACGPLVAVDVFETRIQTLLSITIHHLVVDTVSWRLLLRELESFLLYGSPIQPESTTFKTWTLAQSQFASRLVPEDTLPAVEHLPAVDLSFWGTENLDNCFKNATSRIITFSTEVTKDFLSANHLSGYSTVDILTAAVFESFYETFGRSPSVFIEGHGREAFLPDVDPSGIVGWFTTFSPVIIQQDDNDVLARVRESRALTPLNGLSYFSSRFLNDAGVEAFRGNHWPMEVTINYLGSFQQFETQDSLFRRCHDDLQVRLSELRRQQRESSTRYSLISVLGVVKDGQLSVEIEWNSHMSHQPQLKEWPIHFEQIILQLTQHFLFKLSGKEPLRPDGLCAAWRRIVETHPILRTIFFEDESGAFQQVVLRAVAPSVEILSLDDEGELPAIWAKNKALKWPTPLSGEILHKLKLYAAKNGSIYCLISKNHVITDGTTSRLIIRNLLDAYRGNLRLDVCPYSNYIDYVNKQDGKKITDYWDKYLRGASSCHFPRLRRTLNTLNTPVEFTRVSSVLSNKTLLEAASRKLDLTLPVIFQAAWAVVLSTYLNSEDVMFGMLCNGRDTPIQGAADIVGPMATIVPIRARLASDVKACEVFRSMQADNIEHLSRQAISLAHIQHAAKRGGETMFNTILNFYKAGIAFPSQIIKTELLYSQDTSEYDIAVCVTEERNRLKITVESPTSFLSKPQAHRLLAVYLNAVQTMTNNPDTRVREVSLTTDLDHGQIKQWAPTRLKTSDKCIHDMITNTMIRQPSKPAISSWDGDVTYAELNTLSTKLSVHLQSFGAGPGEIVVLCFEKSLWAVVAMLAVAKSGAAFVHIDPNGAPKRTESIIKQTRSRLGLASPTHCDKLLCVVETITVVDKKSIRFLPYYTTKDLLKQSATPSDTLYIIFTSGTTGRPKGVVIPHGSFCSAVTSNKAWLHIRPTSRVLQFTNYCFDASLEEIFTVLVAGGCICIPSETERMSDLPGFIARKEVNWAAFTPSFLRTLGPDDLETVKFITVHAEPMSQDLVDRWAGKIRMRPSYGPTECSVTSTVGAIFTVGSDATNIGWPIGCRGWVVHPENHNILMPVGAVGELLLDGPIVGQGYLGDGEKTAAAFIEPPLWAVDKVVSYNSVAPRKLYKTGDLVRYAEDGTLLIQRRKDHSQVKIRGQRVELSEIQYHLDNLSELVQHSMVLVPKSGVLEGRLVAVASLIEYSSGISTTHNPNQFPEMIEKSSLSEEASKKLSRVLDSINTSLEKQLPRYMIPETWILVKSLPVQLSLKLDRKLVTDWVEDIDEKTLQAALEVSQHSIAMQVMQLCKLAGFQLTTQDVLANPSVAKLALVASQDVMLDRHAPPTPPRSPDDSVGLSNFTKHILKTDSNVQFVAPCSPFQQRMYHCFLKRPQLPYIFNSLVRLDCVNGSSAMDTTMLQRAWQQTVDRHAMLRAIFFPDPDTSVVSFKVLKEHRADVKVLSVGTDLDAVQQSRDHLTSALSMAFKKDCPPLSVCIFVTEEKEVFAHFVMAHILIDHVSLAHIFSDFAAFYRNQITAPAALPGGFQHYIQHISRTRSVQDSNKYWVEYLKDIKPYMIPSDSLGRSTADPHSMGGVEFSLDITPKMRDFLSEAKVTLSNLLQFNWALLLHVYTGHATVCFGHLVSDRDVDLPHADEIVGPMLSMLIGRASFTDSTSLINSLQTFQEDSIRSLGHKTFELAEVERQLGCEATGFFNTLVNYRKVTYSGTKTDLNFRSVWKQDPHELQQLLVLAFNEEPSRLNATITYYESLFSERTVKTLSETYNRLFKLITSGQQRTVGDVKMALNA